MRRALLTLVAAGVAVFIAAGIALAANITGTPNSDVLTGTDENDVMHGGDGADTMSGMVGSDHVEGGRGADKLYGTDAQQTDMGPEADSLYGEDGDDEMRGGPGADILYGGQDNDTISDGPEDDGLVDDIRSGAASDIIRSANIPHAKDNVFCGDGPNDRVTADPLDVVDRATCENVQVIREVTVYFEGDRAVDQAIQVAQEESAQPEELVATYDEGVDTEYFASYVVGDGATVPSGQEVTQAIVGMFEEDRELLQSTPDDPAADPAVEAAEHATVSDLTSVIQSVQSAGAQIDEMSVQTATPVAELEQNPAVASAAVGQGVPEDPISTQDPNYGPDKDWAPKWGYVKTTCCYEGRRYVYQKWYWNNWRMGNLKRIRDNLTWEQEAIYNRDRGNYLGRTVGGSGNLPDQYLDNASEPPWRPARIWNMGTANAQRLSPNKYYYTKIRTKWGNQDSDGAGVRGQHGNRSPSTCHKWYCVYDNGTDLILNYDPPGYRAPGQETWVSND